jgi:hypothetical protein
MLPNNGTTTAVKGCLDCGHELPAKPKGKTGQPRPTAIAATASTDGRGPKRATFPDLSGRAARHDGSISPAIDSQSWSSLPASARLRGRLALSSNVIAVASRRSSGSAISSAA